MVDQEQITTDLRFNNPRTGRHAEIVSRQVISVRQGIWSQQGDQLAVLVELRVARPRKNVS